MITKPSQLHTINSRHISSCIPSSKREKKNNDSKRPVSSKSEAPSTPLQPFPHWGPKTLHFVAFGQPFPSLPRWPWQDSPSNPSVGNLLDQATAFFFLRQPVRMFQKIISSLKKKSIFHFYQFSGKTSELSRIYLDRSFFFGAKNPTIGPFH